jgi:hypothetical protein
MSPRKRQSTAARSLLKLRRNARSLDEAIRGIVEPLLAGVSCPPTDIEATFAHLNIVGCDAEDLPIAGQLRNERSGRRIIYSTFLSPERRRFTIAHEVAHALISTNGCNVPQNAPGIESLCDRIAAEILMPRDIFRRASRGDISVRQLLRLSQIFHTSVQATGKRLHAIREACFFEIDGPRVVWTTYSRIRVGTVQALDGVVRPVIEEVMSATKSEGERKVYLEDRKHFGWWGFQWLRLNSAKILFNAVPRHLDPKSSSDCKAAD